MQNTEVRRMFEERCLRFGAGILKLVGRLTKDPRGKHLADQLLRSGTSIGANIQEAQAAQSRADFVHKMQISLKEARESAYWLALLREASLTDDAAIPGLINECHQIAAILAQSVITAKSNGRILR